MVENLQNFQLNLLWSAAVRAVFIFAYRGSENSRKVISGQARFIWVAFLKFGRLARQSRIPQLPVL